VVHKVLVTVAWVCCGLVCVSFVLFVHDQLKQGSAHQASLIAPTGPIVPAQPLAHQVAQPRRFIDGAAGDLTSPFDSVVSSDSPWVNHMVPDVFALLVYGGGLGFAARYASGRSRDL
jgi:hypothetical protein